MDERRPLNGRCRVFVFVFVGRTVRSAGLAVAPRPDAGNEITPTIEWAVPGFRFRRADREVRRARNGTAPRCREVRRARNGTTPQRREVGATRPPEMPVQCSATVRGGDQRCAKVPPARRTLRSALQVPGNEAISMSAPPCARPDTRAAYRPYRPASRR